VRARVAKGDEYYRLLGNWSISKEIENGDDNGRDKILFNCGNYFRTIKQAKFFIEQQTKFIEEFHKNN
jgi:hypothetical protein